MNVDREVIDSYMLYLAMLCLDRIDEAEGIKRAGFSPANSLKLHSLTVEVAKFSRFGDLLLELAKGT